MNIKKLLIVFTLLIVGLKVNAQSMTYTFIDPCTKEVSLFTIPLQGGTTIVFLNTSKYFTAQDVSNGTFANWINQTYQAYREIAPCSQQQGQVTQNNITTSIISSTVQSVVGSIMSSAQNSSMSSSDGGSDASSKNNKSDKKKKNNNGSQSGGESTSGSESSTNSTNNTSTSSNNNTNTTTGGGSTTNNNGANSTGGNTTGSSNNSTGGSQSNGTNSGNSNNGSSGGSSGGNEGGGSGGSSNGGGGTGKTTQNSGQTNQGSNESGQVSGGVGTTTQQTGATTEQGAEVAATTTMNTDSHNDNGGDNNSGGGGGGGKGGQRSNPIIVSSDFTNAQNLDRSFTPIVNISAGSSSMTGLSSYGVTAMVWLDFNQFALSGRYTKIHFSKKGTLKFVHNLNLTGVYTYGNFLGFVGYSGILNAGKYGVTGFNTSFAATIISEDKSGFYSPSFTGFYTRPFRLTPKLVISPEIYVISTPLVYSTKEKVTITDRYFSGFVGSGFDYQLSKRFKIILNYKANMSTNPDFPILSFFLVGSKINL